MDLSPLLGALDAGWIDDVLVWSVALAAGVIGLIATVNVLDMFMETDAG